MVWIVLLIVVVVGGTACGEPVYDTQTHETTFEKSKVTKPAQEPR